MHAQIGNYYRAMADRHRLMIGQTEQGLRVVCTFFVLKTETEVPRFYPRALWSTPADVQDGAVIYIDKLVARTFSRALWRQLEGCVSAHIPSWQHARWYRPGRDQDRLCIYHRRSYGTNSDS